MRCAAFIFDLDGTLIDSEILWTEAAEQFLREHGCPVSHAEALELVYGHSWFHVYESITRRYPGLTMGQAAMTDAMRHNFLRLAGTRNLVIPGSVQLLRRLAAQHPVCVVSGSTRHDVEAGIAMAGVGALLSFAIAAEDYGRGKPDPECFLLAARRMSVAPAQCLVFEDSAAGVRAAKAAGMACVALVREGRPPQDVTAADLVVSDLTDFDPDCLNPDRCPTAQD